MLVPTLPTKPIDPENAVAVMFSGGMDSTVIIAAALAKGKDVYPIAFDDGSLNFRLRRSVAIELTLQKLGLYNKLILARIPFLEQLRISKDVFGFIPGMKASMMLTSMMYCQSLGISALAMGYNKDNSNRIYRDEDNHMMDEFTDLYYRMYGLETQTDFYFGKRIDIINPYYDRSKAEMVIEGARLGVDFSTTISCREVAVGAGLLHCGKCIVCKRRKRSFVDSGVDDPTMWYTTPDLTDDGTGLY